MVHHNFTFSKKMNYTHIIYKLTFPNNKIYIGQTKKDFIIYMSSYKNDSTNIKRKDYNRLINKAIRKYGWDNIKQEIICTVSEEFVDDAERYFIKKYNSNNRNFGYNLESGGHKNKCHSEETKKKISNAKMGKKLSEEHKKKLKLRLLNNTRRLGKFHTLETIQKIKNNMPDVSGKNNPFFGKRHTKYSMLKKSKPIDMYDLNNNFIKSFPSMTQASVELNISITSICNMLKNRTKTSHNKLFKYH